MKTNHGSGSKLPFTRGRSKIADNAGLKVSELNAEITVETAMVNANWRKNCPMMPVMNAHGTNNRRQHQGRSRSPGPTLLHRLEARLARRQAMFDVMRDGLDDDDSVVNDNADRQPPGRTASGC